METPFYNFDYTGGVQEKTLPAGEYLLECWGARGGGLEDDPESIILAASGKGGYSRGLIKLFHETTLYIHVGGKGPIGYGSRLFPVFVKGGYNGGGSGFASLADPIGGGGGGTDIRLNIDSIYARVIVAGGGGGSGGDKDFIGGFGGGLTGGYGKLITPSPGGQTPPTYDSFEGGGGFFQGAHTDRFGGGAGGGWYGANAFNGQDHEYTEVGKKLSTGGGSGGSGYVYTEETAVNYPEGCLLNESYYLKSAETIGGDQGFLGPDGRFEVGHNGDGYVRITKSRFQFLDLDNETCALKSHERTYCIENITIPNEYADLKVISILAYAFSGNPCIKRVFIPNTIITIHRYAFYYCENLETVEFETNSSLTYIGLSSFSMSGITNITIPENISIIESSAFALCKNLTNVTTCSRRYLNTANAFENCDKLTDIFVSPYYEGDEFCGFKVTHKSDCCSYVPKLRCIRQTRREYCQRKLNVAPANIMLLRLL